jgi:hypothetical protein
MNPETCSGRGVLGVVVIRQPWNPSGLGIGVVLDDSRLDPRVIQSLESRGVLQPRRVGEPFEVGTADEVDLPRCLQARDPTPRQRVAGGVRIEEMAQEVTARIVADVFAQHAITRIRIAHRLGPVPVGEACVVVVVSAEHRGPAFDACRIVMDRLKHEVPIWKRELLRDGGGERWVGELPKVDPLR